MEDAASLHRALASFRADPDAFLLASSLDLDAFVQQMLVALAADARDDDARIQILLLWQEFAPLLFHASTRIDKITATLTALTSTPLNVQAQILMTLTAILTHVDAVRDHPRALAVHVGRLLELVKQTNVSTNRLVRLAACQCLGELEQTWPGLLYDRLGLLYALVQEETTHASQAYLLLFVAVLQHYLRVVVPDLPAPLAPFLATPNRGTFVTPDHLRRRAVPAPASETKPTLLANPDASPPWTADVKRCVTVSLDAAALLTPSAMVDAVLRLGDIVVLTGLPSDPFKYQFQRLATSTDLVQVHLVLQLIARFPSLFNAEDRTALLVQLVGLVVSAHSPEDERLLVAEWLLAAPAALGLRSDALAPFRVYFYPTAFDGLRMKQLKLRLLCRCFGDGTSPPRDLLNVLKCLDTFPAYGTDDAPAAVFFNALDAYLDAFPSLDRRVQDRLHDALLADPRFMDHFVLLLERIRAQAPASSFLLRAVQGLSTRLCELDPADFASNASAYVAVLERVCRERDVDAVTPLRYLLEVLRTSDLCERGSWPFGLQLLRLARAVFYVHPSTVVFGVLKDLLTQLTQAYANLDVRDQAQFLLLVLTHVSRDKAMRILRSRSSASSTDDPALTLTDVAALPTAVPKVTPVMVFGVPFLVLERGATQSTRRCPIDDAVLRGPLPAHLALLRSPTFSVSATIDVVVRYNDAPAVKRLASVIPPKVFSVAIELQTAVPTTGRTRLVVPYLEADAALSGTSAPAPAAPTASAGPLAFPHAYALPLDLPLAAPTAAWFTVAAIYTTVDGLSQTAALDPFYARFDDLLVLATPPSADGAVVAGRFAELWQHFGRLCQSEEEVDADGVPTEEPPGGEAYESVKHVALAAVDMKRLITRHFGPFRVVPAGGPSPAHDNTVQYMWALLPPRHLLLVRFAMTATTTVVTFRCDSWRPLAYVDALMDSLVTEAAAA